MQKNSIVSLSLPSRTLSQLDAIQNDGGFSGRSETLRAALRLLIQEHEDRKKMKGRVNALLLVVTDEAHNEMLATIRHKHQKIIHTQLHEHLASEACMDVLLLDGDSREIVQLSKACEAARGVKRCTLLVV